MNMDMFKDTIVSNNLIILNTTSSSRKEKLEGLNYLQSLILDGGLPFVHKPWIVNGGVVNGILEGSQEDFLLLAHKLSKVIVIGEFQSNINVFEGTYRSSKLKASDIFGNNLASDEIDLVSPFLGAKDYNLQVYTRSHHKNKYNDPSNAYGRYASNQSNRYSLPIHMSYSLYPYVKVAKVNVEDGILELSYADGFKSELFVEYLNEYLTVQLHKPVKMVNRTGSLSVMYDLLNIPKYGVAARKLHDYFIAKYPNYFGEDKLKGISIDIYSGQINALKSEAIYDFSLENPFAMTENESEMMQSDLGKCRLFLSQTIGLSDKAVDALSKIIIEL